MHDPEIPLQALDQLWFQVAGTRCNIACDHCFISCSPTNRTFDFMTLAEIQTRLEESILLGVREYYFTGGEPFMHPQLLDILALTLQYGPTSVLTNGMLLNDTVVQKLHEIEAGTNYSLEIRVSLDGYTAEMNDPIRGKGVFKKTIAGVQRLVRHHFLPIITIAKTWADTADAEMHADFVALLKSIGYDRPRLKILPALKIGREIARDRGYAEHERITPEMLADYDTTHLLCASGRIATNHGIYVCPILINEPAARLGGTLTESFKNALLCHQACYTCYLYGAICANFAAGTTDGA